uniref:VHS domain-containing protein n=1 Tax=Oryza brachyantha TaxID=4533 RepID=J3L5D8_ORYBR
MHPHLLMGPDWAVNLEICDIINADVWQTKDVVKAVKKRLQNKDPKVQFYALTLLETMMKNCGEYVQFEVAEQHVLQEMVKIIQKKNDMLVRDKILLLLDSWQEAFGGPGSKYPQYHFAYLEVKRIGAVFPRRPIDAPPIFTPPATHNSQNYGSPRYEARSLNERMSSDVETLSLGDMNKIRNVTELLCDMVHALNPADHKAVQDEIIMDLVSQCRSNQQKLMQFVSSTGNEQLLKQALEINDRLQSILSRYDTMASGTHLAVEAPLTENVEAPNEDPAEKPSAPPVEHNDTLEDDDDDEFTRLAQRKNKSVMTSDDTLSSTGDLALVPIDMANSESSSSVASNALVPVDPALVSSIPQAKEQDMIDLLSLTLCSPTDEASTDSSTQGPNGPQQPAVIDGQPNPSAVPQYPSNHQPHPTNQEYIPQNRNYIAPWAQTGEYYPAPPWAAPPSVNTNPFQSATYQQPPSPVGSVSSTATYSAPSASHTPTSTAYVPPSASLPMQWGSASNGLTATQAQMNGHQQPSGSSVAANKPYYIPDNLFSDLIDLKGLSGGNKMGGPSSMGNANGGQPMIGGKK